MFKRFMRRTDVEKNASPANKAASRSQKKAHAKEDNQPARDHHKAAPHGQADKRPKQRKRKTDKPATRVEKPENWSLDEFQVEQVPGQTRFHDLGLPDTVMRGIHKLGFQYCTPIQAESLPAALRGRDTIGQAQTGTGKSAAFILTILNQLLTEKPQQRYASEPRALIVAPTRELALQIGVKTR